MKNGCTVEELHWAEQPIGRIDWPLGTIELVWGFGSGLATRPGDPPGRCWAVGDRGPNLHVHVAVERYGLGAVAQWLEREGAKVMARPDIGPALAELQVRDDWVELIRLLPIRDSDGVALSGLPPSGSAEARLEPAVDAAGRLLAPDPSGADTEGIVALADGGFVVADEYGPSLLRLDATGQVVERWVAAGQAGSFSKARYPVHDRLPALALRRRLNRGFEAVAPTADGGLLLAFQSPLANPDSAVSKDADHVRLWRADAQGRCVREYLYRLEPPAAFRRDSGARRGDRKVSELTALGGDTFIVLERVSASTKLFRVDLSGGTATPDDDYPTLEARSAAGEMLPALVKTLLLDSDDHPELGSDIEGVTMLAADALLLVNDNDFGVEGARTRFWRVRFDAPLTAAPHTP